MAALDVTYPLLQHEDLHNCTGAHDMFVSATRRVTKRVRQESLQRQAASGRIQRRAGQVKRGQRAI